MDHYDVIVIGAGPAGCSAARSLSDYGFKVLVLERQSLPREKACDGVIDAETLRAAAERFGEIPGYAFLTNVPVRELRVFLPRDREHRITYIPPRLAVNRAIFDKHLATSCGATLMEGACAQEVNMGRFFHSVKIVRDQEELTCESTYLVGADGADSQILQALRPEFSRLYQRPALRHVVSLHFTHESEFEYSWRGAILLDRPKCALRLAVFPGRFHLSFVIPPGGGWENLLTLVLPLLESRCNLKKPEISGKRLAIINFMGSNQHFNLGAGSVLLAGEASGLLDPWGDGIALALESGRIAGEAIIESAGERVTPHVHYRSRIASLMENVARQHAGKEAPKDADLSATPFDPKKIAGRKRYRSLVKSLCP